MSAAMTLPELYGTALERLTAAASRGDVDTFHAALDALVEQRERGVYSDLRVLTESLVGAMNRFRQDFRITDLAEREIPDARVRLNHVLSLTDAAAHRTMDLIEACGPLADSTGRGAAALAALWSRYRGKEMNSAEKNELFAHLDTHLTESQHACGELRNNLSEVMLAQGYQDITGQIIRGVITLVGEVETALEQLVCLAGSAPGADPDPLPRPAVGSVSRGFGPAVPGVSQNTVDGQDDLDALMAGLGI